MTTTSNRVLNREELVQITGLCSDSLSIGDLVSQIGRVILPSLDLSAVAITPIESEGGPIKSIVASGVPLKATAHRKIGRHIAQRIDDRLEHDIVLGDMAIVRVACRIPTHAVLEIDDSTTGWSTVVQPRNGIAYLLSVFGPRREISHQSITKELLLLGDLMERSAPLARSGLSQNGGPESIIVLTMEHYEAIQAVFGRDETQSVVNKIEDILRSSLPIDSRVARHGADQIIAIVNSDINDTKHVVSKCKLACANMELEGKILIKLAATISPLNRVTMPQPHDIFVANPDALPHVEAIAS